MTPSQRAATLSLCEAILACACATPDLRLRAQNLRARVSGDWSRLAFGDILPLPVR